MASKTVAIKLAPPSLAQSVCEALLSYKSNDYLFTCELNQATDIIVINDDDLLFEAMEEGKEPLQLSKNLDQQQILDRLTRKFNLI